MAAGWAEQLPADLSVIVVDVRDEGALRDAYAEAIRRRIAAQNFYVATVLPNTGVELGLAVSGAIADQSYDRRRGLLDRLADGTLEVNGLPVAQISVLSNDTLKIVRGLHVLADAILVRSAMEYQLQTLLINHWRRHVAYYASPPHFTQGLRSNGGGAFVVWAPHLPWQQTMILATALEEMKTPVTIVAATLPPRPMAAAFVLRDEGLRALSSALAVMDADFTDPGPSLALAQLGIPLASARSNGVEQYLDNVSTYLPWEWRSIQAAAYNSLGARRPRLRRHGFDLEAVRETLAEAGPPATREGPLVSIIIPTYNRPKKLERVLRAFSNQTYDNVECIVVNDAGESVDDVVSRFPKARVIDLPMNTNNCGATPVNAGAAHARGKYVGFMADDDVCYPDHVARLVEVLERTGIGVAHANIAIRFVRNDGDREVTTGFDACGAISHLDPHAALLSSTVSLTTTLTRRELLEELGYYSTELWSIADNELMLRLSLRTDCAHVDHVTTEWRVSIDGSNRSMQLSKTMAEQMQRMWAQHPYPDRPTLQQERSAALAGVTALQPGELYREPAITFTKYDVADFGY